MDVAVDLEPEIALAGQARRQPAHRAADPGIAPDAAGESVRLRAIGHADSRADLSAGSSFDRLRMRTLLRR